MPAGYLEGCVGDLAAMLAALGRVQLEYLLALTWMVVIDRKVAVEGRKTRKGSSQVEWGVPTNCAA